MWRHRVIALTWLVNSPRVQKGFRAPGGEAVASLASVGAKRVNEGPDWELIDAGEATLAVEIPHNWTALQAEDPDAGRALARVNGPSSAKILGHEPGRYALTGVAEEGARRYLIAERVTSSLLESLVGVGRTPSSVKPEVRLKTVQC